MRHKFIKIHLGLSISGKVQVSAKLVFLPESPDPPNSSLINQLFIWEENEKKKKKGFAGKSAGSECHHHHCGVPQSKQDENKMTTKEMRPFWVLMTNMIFKEEYEGIHERCHLVTA